MTRRRLVYRWIAFLLVVSVGFACQFPPGNWGNIPSPPQGHIPASQEAAERLKHNFSLGLQEASAGREFRLFVSNEEITSLVTFSLQDSSILQLSDAQVWFTAGHVYLTGTFSPFWPLSFSSLIVATPVVRDGQIAVEVEQAQMGPFPFPQGVLASASQSLNERLAAMQMDLQITTLQVLEGELQLAGTRRPL